MILQGGFSIVVPFSLAAGAVCHQMHLGSARVPTTGSDTGYSTNVYCITKDYTSNLIPWSMLNE